jgi:hypothetical protein
MRKKLLTLSILTLALSSFEAFSSDFTANGNGTPLEAYTNEVDCQIQEVQCLDNTSASIKFSGFCSREEITNEALRTCGPDVSTLEFHYKINIESTEEYLSNQRTRSRSNGSEN